MPSGRVRSGRVSSAASISVSVSGRGTRTPGPDGELVAPERPPAEQVGHRLPRRAAPGQGQSRASLDRLVAGRELAGTIEARGLGDDDAGLAPRLLDAAGAEQCGDGVDQLA